MSECQRMVSMNVPGLDVSGLPQLRCGAPVPRENCPFDDAPYNAGCPWKESNSG